MPDEIYKRRRVIYSVVAVFHLILVSVILFLFSGEVTSFFERPWRSTNFQIFISTILVYGISAFISAVSSFFSLRSYNKIVDSDDVLFDENSSRLYGIFKVLIIGPVSEELLFRIAPFGLSVVLLAIKPEFIVSFFESLDLLDYDDLIEESVALIATGIWVSTHERRFPVMLPIGILFYILLLEGLIFEVLIAHLIINTFFLLFRYVENYTSDI